MWAGHGELVRTFEKMGLELEWEGRQQFGEDAQEVTDDAEGEDGHSKSIASKVGVAPKDLCDDLVMVLWIAAYQRLVAGGQQWRRWTAMVDSICVPCLAAMLQSGYISNVSSSIFNDHSLPEGRVEHNGPRRD